MIYKIVLDMDAKVFCKAHCLKDGEVIKPHLALEEIKAIEALQRIDIGLNEMGLTYDERKEKAYAEL